MDKTAAVRTLRKHGIETTKHIRRGRSSSAGSAARGLGSVMRLPVRFRSVSAVSVRSGPTSVI